MNLAPANTIYLFTDGSANPQTKEGFGAILWVNDINTPTEQLKQKVVVQKFENTSSTKLELETLLWAFDNFEHTKQNIVIYTDSQNQTGLLNRRARLEDNNYLSKKKAPITNADLYKRFYALHDKLKFQLVKVKGHQASRNKNEIEKIFSLVDKAARNKLRHS